MKMRGKIIFQAISILMLMGSELLITLILSRFLGKSGFGVYAFSYAVAFIGFQLVDVRAADVIVAFYPSLHRKKPALGHVVITIAVVLDALRGGAGLLLILLLGPLLTPFVWSAAPPVREVLLMAGFLCVNNLVLNATRGFFRITDAYALLALLQACAAALKVGAVLLAFAHSTADVQGVLRYMLVSAALFLIVNALLLRWHARRLGFGAAALRIYGSRLPWKSMLRFIRYNYLAGLSTIVTKELDVLILSSHADAAVIGVYRLARSLAAGLGALGDALFFVLFPEVSHLVARKDRAGLRRLVRRNMLWGLSAALGFAFVGWLATAWLIEWFYAGSGYDSVPLLFLVLAFQYVIWVPMMWLNPLLLSRGFAHLSARAVWVGAVVTAIMLWAGASMWGAYGTAAAKAFSSAAVLLPMLWMASHAGLLSWLQKTRRKAEEEGGPED